jgi:predicted 3-demethylubiquinone-9 3-methyltransferase (glyoxalase superfamily)
MPRSVTTFLMFEGKAEEAMTFYVSLFNGSAVTRLERYGPGEPGAEGSVKRAEFTVGGHPLLCIDSPIKHAFTFTPSMSLFVECEDEAELDTALARLSDGGNC